MPIVNSIIVEDLVQADGRRAIRERHTDHLGAFYDVVYLCEIEADPLLILASRAAQIEADLSDSEVRTNLIRAYEQQSPILAHSTAAAFRAVLRAAFKTASAWDTVRLGKFINGLGLTDNQLKALFSINDAQLVTLKAKLVALAAKYDDVISQQGE